MDLFTYLMAKKGHNTHRDLFSYLLGKNAGGSGTYTTFSGTSLNISNTLQAKIKNIALKGNTTQEGTPTPDSPVNVNVVAGNQEIVVSGKNLLPLVDGTASLNGLTITVNNSTITLNGSSNSSTIFKLTNGIEAYNSSQVKSDWLNETIIDNKNNTTLSLNYISGTGDTSGCAFRTFGNDSTYINQFYPTATSQNTTYNSSGKISCVVFFTASGKTFTNYKFSIQLEKGNQVTTYEPYQSQSYEINLGNIELCKIGDYQDKIAKSTGINILSGIEQGTINSSGEPVSSPGAIRSKNFDSVMSNTQYTVSINGTATPINVAQYDSNKTFISYTYYNGTFTTSATTRYIKISKGGSITDLFQINKGTTSLPYEPYGKVWYLNKQIGKVVLDGSENWDNDAGTLGTSYRHNISVSNLGIATPILPQQPNLSNYFKYNYSNIGDFGNFYLASDWLVFTDKNQVYTLANFKTWLSTHNTTVYYVLATPNYTEITDTTLIQQLENIYNNARSYKDTTIIECSSASTDNETIGFSGDIKVTSVGNSLNTSLLSSNLQEETNINDIQEEPNLDDVNEIEDIEQNDEPIQNEEIEEEVS